MGTNNKNIALDFAEFIIAYCAKNNIENNHFKIQKLLYYIQAWHLVYFKKELIFDELPEAWMNGPVYKSVYDVLKNKVKPTTILKLSKNTLENIDTKFQEVIKELGLDKEKLEFLDSIMNFYGILNHEKLILLTHQEKPWNEARKGLGVFDYSDKKISSNTMYTYYKERMERVRKKNE